MFGPDAKASLSIDQFKEMNKSIRFTEKALNMKKKILTKDERTIKNDVWQSIISE